MWRNMGAITYQDSRYVTKTIPLESNVSLFLRNSLRYASRAQRYAGAIVPNDVYPQAVPTPQGAIFLCHAVLPVSVDVSRVHKWLWSARNGTLTLPRSPDDLEVFAVLTGVEPDPEIAYSERKVCDILFPGVWALAVWRKNLCLWHGGKQLLRANPRHPQGLVAARHPNLDAVLTQLLP